MPLGRAVAGFARDAQVGHARLEALRRLVGPRLRAGGVAADAVHVPVLLADDRVRVADEQAVARRPALVVDQPSEGEADLQVALHAGQPKDLHVMRAGDHAQAQMERLRVVAVGRGVGRLDALDARPVFVTAPVHGEAFALKLVRLAVERRPDGLGRDELRHGAVVRGVPAFVLVGMAVAARGRAGVFAVVASEGQGGGEGRLRLAKRLAGRFRRGGKVDGQQDDGDNRQGNYPSESGGVNFWIIAVHVARPR